MKFVIFMLVFIAVMIFWTLVSLHQLQTPLPPETPVYVPSTTVSFIGR